MFMLRGKAIIYGKMAYKVINLGRHNHFLVSTNKGLDNAGEKQAFGRNSLPACLC